MDNEYAIRHSRGSSTEAVISDDMIYAAVKGSAARFKEAYHNILSPSAQEYVMAAVYAKNDAEKIAYISRHPMGSPFLLDGSYTGFRPSRAFLLYQLLVTDDTEKCRHLIVNFPNVLPESFKNYWDNVLYIIMLSGKYELIETFFNLKMGGYFFPIAEELKNVPASVFHSAVRHREKDFLLALRKYGSKINIFQLASIAYDDDMMSFYMNEIDGGCGHHGIGDLMEHHMDSEMRLAFLAALPSMMGKENYEAIYDSIPVITEIDSFSLFNCSKRKHFTDCRPIRFAPVVTVRAHTIGRVLDNRIWEHPFDTKDTHFVYDCTKADSIDIFMSLYPNQKSIEKILCLDQILPWENKLCREFIIQIVDMNKTHYIYLLIKNGHINEKNAAEIIDHAAENKLLNVIAAISHYSMKHGWDIKI